MEISEKINLEGARKLGDGKFGDVCLTIIEGVPRAIKSIPLKQNVDTEKAWNELELQKRAKCEQVVEVYELQINQQPPRLLIVMEYVEGGTLLALINNNPLQEWKTINYLRQILTGIAYMHDQNVVHRDIKPGNILLDRTGSKVKICDFGLAKEIPAIRDDTCLQSHVGTIAYMCPEAIKAQKYGTNADIWSVGATAVHMVTGERPYPQLDNTWTIMFKVGSHELKYDLKGMASAQLDGFVGKFMEIDRNRKNNHLLLVAAEPVEPVQILIVHANLKLNSRSQISSVTKSVERKLARAAVGSQMPRASGSVALRRAETAKSTHKQRNRNRSLSVTKQKPKHGERKLARITVNELVTSINPMAPGPTATSKPSQEGSETNQHNRTPRRSGRCRKEVDYTEPYFVDIPSSDSDSGEEQLGSDFEPNDDEVDSDNEPESDEEKSTNKTQLAHRQQPTHKFKNKKRRSFQKTYICSVSECGYETPWKSDLKHHHQHRHSNEKPFKCSMCDHRTASKKTMTTHEKSFKGELFQCGWTPCPQRFCTTKSRTSHEQLVHGSKTEKHFVCEDCNLSFKLRANYNRHMESAAHSEPLHQCAKCGKRFSQAPYRDRHQKQCKYANA